MCPYRGGPEPTDRTLCLETQDVWFFFFVFFNFNWTPTLSSPLPPLLPLVQTDLLRGQVTPCLRISTLTKFQSRGPTNLLLLQGDPETVRSCRGGWVYRRRSPSDGEFGGRVGVVSPPLG